jgi:hydrogenase small subunit
MGQVFEIPAIWIQAAGCTGCSISLLNADYPNIKNVLIDEVVPQKHVNLRFHPNIMAGQGEGVLELLINTKREKKKGYVLIVEGAIPTKDNGIYGVIGEKNGKPITILSWVLELSESALAVIAFGSCATFGGIPKGKPNPTGCKSVGEVFEEYKISTPYINIPGCPPHPDWFVGTVASILLSGLPKEEDLDELHRPKLFFSQTIHENCPRRAYYDEKKFAKKFGDPGCLYELGCRGPVTYADCPIRLWNSKVNWCIGSGATCIGCCSEGFLDEVSPLYVKLEEAEFPKEV